MMRHPAVCLLMIGLALAPPPARATVLEIGDDGTVTTYGAPQPKPARASGAAARPVPIPARLAAPVAAAGEAAALANDLIAAVAWVESRFEPAARSPAGARGLMQLMPATARELGVDPARPAANLRGGAAYLRRLLDRFDGDLVKAIAAYNAGPGAVERHGGVPPYPETRRYVAAVLDRLARQPAR